MGGPKTMDLQPRDNNISGEGLRFQNTDIYIINKGLMAEPLIDLSRN